MTILKGSFIRLGSVLRRVEMGLSQSTMECVGGLRVVPGGLSLNAGVKWHGWLSFCGCFMDFNAGGNGRR